MVIVNKMCFSSCRHRSSFIHSAISPQASKTRSDQTDRALAFVADRGNICLAFSLVTVQNLVLISHAVRADDVGDSKIWSGVTVGPYPLGRGRGWPRRNTPVTHVLRTGFRGSRSNRLGVGIGVPKIVLTLGPTPFGRGMADPLKYAILHMCHRTKFRRCRSSRFGVIREVPIFWDAGYAGTSEFLQYEFVYYSSTCYIVKIGHSAPCFRKKCRPLLLFSITSAKVDQFSYFSLLTSERICGGSLN